MNLKDALCINVILNKKHFRKKIKEKIHMTNGFSEMELGKEISVILQCYFFVYNSLSNGPNILRIILRLSIHVLTHRCL